jgi:hypothetical protein
MEKTRFTIAPYNPRKITQKQREELETWLSQYGDLSGVVFNRKTGNIVGGNQRSSIFNINECEIERTLTNKKPDSQGTVSIGYIIWNGNKYNFREVSWELDVEKRANIIANKAGGAWDFDKMAEAYKVEELFELGFDAREVPSDYASLAERQRDEIQKKTKASSALRYEIVFTNEGEQSAFEGWLRQLKKAYPTHPTISSRIIAFINEAK